MGVVVVKVEVAKMGGSRGAVVPRLAGALDSG
jgi:hypothetical protein